MLRYNLVVLTVNSGGKLVHQYGYADQGDFTTKGV